ncbi:MAG: ATP-binding protein [Pseudomonadota bacterium]
MPGSTPSKTLLFRMLGYLLVPLLALALPMVGDNRFWLAFAIVAVAAPLALLIHLRLSLLNRHCAEPLLDLVLVLIFAHLVPDAWMAVLCLSLMIAMAPSVGLHPTSHLLYASLGSIVVLGMVVLIAVHDIQGWEMPMAIVIVVYPSMLYYARQQTQVLNELRDRAQRLQGMSDLAGSIAHDFNNMLTSISGYTELALDSLPAQHASREDLEQVLGGAERGAKLCRQLLSFSGGRTRNVHPAELGAELRAMAELLRPVMPAGVGVDVHDPHPPIWIDAEVSQLQQVLMNVLLNAGEAMIGRQGVIKARLLAADQQRGHVQLIVRDHGPGIARGTLEQVFDPQFTTKDRGHGIGLAATKKIMQACRGQIDIVSGVGGTEVVLEWRLAPRSAIEKADARVPDPRATPAPGEDLILVVDDDSDVREVARRQLERLEYRAVEAADADEAVRVFRREHGRLHAVILDLKMPLRDGWSCLQELRSISKNTRIVVCSGFDPRPLIPEFARDDRQLRVLNKPYLVEEMGVALS